MHLGASSFVFMIDYDAIHIISQAERDYYSQATHTVKRGEFSPCRFARRGLLWCRLSTCADDSGQCITGGRLQLLVTDECASTELNLALFNHTWQAKSERSQQ
jgi:hypothetical protein